MGSVKFLKKQACSPGGSWIQAPLGTKQRGKSRSLGRAPVSHNPGQKAHFPYCCCSVAKSCPILCNPMDYSTPGFPLLHCLLEFAQTHIRWCYLTISSSAALFFFCLQSFPALGSFPGSQLFTSGGQSIAASASVLTVNIQGWFSF